MRLLTRLLENTFPSMDTLVVLNLKKSVLDRMVHLVSRGYVTPVLRYISNINNNDKIDASLIRHFVGEILEIASPPYRIRYKNVLMFEEQQISVRIIKKFELNIFRFVFKSSKRYLRRASDTTS